MGGLGWERERRRAAGGLLSKEIDSSVASALIFSCILNVILLLRSLSYTVLSPLNYHLLIARARARTYTRSLNRSCTMKIHEFHIRRSYIIR